MTLEKIKNKLKAKSQEINRKIRSSVTFLYLGVRDPRMPVHVKLLILLIIAYVISPIDLIPDFIPVIGLLDDIILVPILLACVIRLMPENLKHEYESREPVEIEDKRLARLGAAIVILVWIVITAVCLYYLNVNWTEV